VFTVVVWFFERRPSGRTSHMEASLAWSEWPVLKHHPWEWFVTLTFPFGESKTNASKALRTFTNKLARRTHFARGQSATLARKVGLPWLGVVGTHKNGSYHIHALLSQVQKDTIVKTWKAFISWNAVLDVRPYNPSRDAIGYMKKHGDLMIGNWFLKAGSSGR
jgi:hypothetical protein